MYSYMHTRVLGITAEPINNVGVSLATPNARPKNNATGDQTYATSYSTTPAHHHPLATLVMLTILLCMHIRASFPRLIHTF